MRLKNAYKKAKKGSIIKSSSIPGSHVVGMPGGGEIKYIPPTQGRIYNDNTRVVTPTPISSSITPKASISSFLKDKDYQSPDYTSKKEVNPTIKRVLNSADLATDVLQLGHFSPDPFMIGQTAGLIGDVVGAGVDALQSGISAYEGNTKDAVMNAGLALLPSITKKFGYERPASLMTGKGSGMYRPLTATNPTLANNPVIKKGLGWNRATLGANALEVISNKSPKMPNGGVLPADYTQFEKFHKSLPSNLQDSNYKYNDPNNYNLYGMWEGAGKPLSFNDVKDGELFPLQDDGTYHGFSVNPNTGEFLKPKNHKSTWMEVRESQLNPNLQDQRIIQNENGRLQYVPRTMRDGGKYLPTAVSQQLTKRPSSGLKEAYKRRKKL